MRRKLAGGSLVVLVAATAARASVLVPPDIGVEDSAVAGNVVANPDDGASILFYNPAGVPPGGTEASFGVFLLPISGRITNDATGFDEKSSELALSPVAFAGTDRYDPWFVAFGLYGSVGTSFSFGGDPAAGLPNRFLAESSVVQLGFVAGREVAPGLRMGLQIAPTFGRIRLRSPSPKGPLRFDVEGVGIGGAAGLLWDVTERTTFGVGYRAPGRVFLDGDGDVGATDDEVEITFRVPQFVAFGFAHRLMERTTLSVQARWADYPDFEDAVFEFERNPDLNRAFVPSARSQLRYGGGVEFDVTDEVVLRAGASYEGWAMEEESLTPLLYDNTDLIIGLGFGASFGRWTLDATTGTSWVEDRVVTADRNPLFPGRYEIEVPFVAGFGVTYQF